MKTRIGWLAGAWAVAGCSAGWAQAADPAAMVARAPGDAGVVVAADRPAAWMNEPRVERLLTAVAGLAGFNETGKAWARFVDLLGGDSGEVMREMGSGSMVVVGDFGSWGGSRGWGLVVEVDETFAERMGRALGGVPRGQRDGLPVLAVESGRLSQLEAAGRQGKRLIGLGPSEQQGWIAEMVGAQRAGGAGVDAKGWRDLGDGPANVAARIELLGSDRVLRVRGEMTPGGGEVRFAVPTRAVANGAGLAGFDRFAEGLDFAHGDATAGERSIYGALALVQTPLGGFEESLADGAIMLGGTIDEDGAVKLVIAARSPEAFDAAEVDAVMAEWSGVPGADFGGAFAEASRSIELGPDRTVTQMVEPGGMLHWRTLESGWMVFATDAPLLEQAAESIGTLEDEGEDVHSGAMLAGVLLPSRMAHATFLAGKGAGVTEVLRAVDRVSWRATSADSGTMRGHATLELAPAGDGER